RVSRAPGRPLGGRDHRYPRGARERRELRRCVAPLRRALPGEVSRARRAAGSVVLLRPRALAARASRALPRGFQRARGAPMNSDVLVRLEEVVKDYPKIATGGARLRTLAA